MGGAPFIYEFIVAKTSLPNKLIFGEFICRYAWVMGRSRKGTSPGYPEVSMHNMLP